MSALSLLSAACLGFGLLACSSGNVLVGLNHGADTDAGTSGAGGSTLGDPSAAQLLAALGACNEISNGELSPESGRTADVKVCGLGTAVYWKSEFAVDCDGKQGSTCNTKTDPQSTPSTVGKDSAGNSLDAAAVPYIEVPATNSVFDYTSVDLNMGSVAAVIYKDHLAYGVIGQEQDAGVIGSGSYAMAVLLGIDPNPKTGGLETEIVTYVAFTGPANQVTALEDTTQATTIGKAAAAALVASTH